MSGNMKTHRNVLAKALKDSGHTHRTVALAMDWKSPASAGHKLTGRTDWSEGELAKMCALADMTIVELVAASDDMPGYFKNRKAAEAAALLDRLTDKQLDAVLSVLRIMQSGRA